MLAMADEPIWVNAKKVKATFTDCGRQHFLLLKGDKVNVPAPPQSPRCKSYEVFYHQVNVAKTFFRPENKGQIVEANVDAGYITCGQGLRPSDAERGIIILGTAGEIERAKRRHLEPEGCTFTMEKYQYLSSIGSIPFTDVPNGGTMSVKESLALHAKERERAIAECNASPACQAEVRRRSAINAYYECMKPLQRYEAERTCYRPW